MTPRRDASIISQIHDIGPFPGLTAVARLLPYPLGEG